MTSIRNMTAATEVESGDQIPIYSAHDGDNRRLSVSLLQEYMQDNLTFSAGNDVVQYASPTTGQTVTVTLTADRSTWLVITPAGTLSELTIAIDGTGSNLQELLINTSQTLTSLTFSGATFQGAPSTLSANGFAKLRYDEVNTIWRRVG